MTKGIPTMLKAKVGDSGLFTMVQERSLAYMNSIVDRAAYTDEEAFSD